MTAQKLEPLRILYAVVVAASVGLAIVFYCRYQLEKGVLLRYRQSSLYSNQTLKNLSTEFARNKAKSNQLLEQVSRLNETIRNLEQDNLAFKEKARMLKNENESLTIEITRLLEEKEGLENNFYSLERLKQAIIIARKEKRLKDRIARIQRRLTEIKMLKALDEVALRLGNNGYLVRGGYSTFRPRIRVEIEPLD